nr:hypothetical protein [Mucilaginibacter sp. L294]
MRYQIKRAGETIVTVRPDSGEQKKEIMLTDMVSMAFTLNTAAHFQHGDYVDVWAERYYLNELSQPEKLSTIKHKYSLTFQAGWYDLGKPLFFMYDSLNLLWSYSEFQLMCTADEALDLVIANANREQTGWVKGNVQPTTTKQLAFTGEETVLQALTQIAQAFECEWWIVGKTIHLENRQNVSGYHFEYGRGKGLRGGLKRTNVDATGAFSRLYVRGSEQNLPFDYRGGQSRLILPAPLPYIQGVKYGAHEIERAVTFDDIKPERLGTVTAIGDKYTFSDSGLDFDINEQLLPDLSPKITFQNGQCAGYVFEIRKGGYNHATRTITFLPAEQEKALDMPSDLLRPAIGDTYVLSDVKMPGSYITNAEARLLAKGTEYFTLNSPPKVSYTIPPDPFHFERHDIVLTIGDTVNVSDLDIEINKDIRVTAYSRDLHNRFKYTSVTISDIVKGGIINSQFTKAEDLSKAIALNKISDIQRAKRNWKTTGELSTLLDTVKAEMLLITMDGGAYSTNLVATVGLADFAVTAGRVVHEQYTEGNGIWEVAAFNGVGALADNKPYYVYIKAGRNTGTATIQLSLTKLAVESDPLYYYFPFAVISSIIDGGRLFTSLRGYTRVTGDTISLGRIVSNNNLNYLDLSANTFNLGDDTSGLDWGVTASGQLTIRGSIVATGATFVNLIVQNIKTAAVGHKRIEIDATTNNIRLIDAANSDLLVIDDDAAIVGYQINDFPLPPTPIYGAGIMIGNISGAYLSLAKNGLITTGSIEAANIAVTGNATAVNFANTITIGAGSLPNHGTVMATGDCNLYTAPLAGQRQVVKNKSAGTITISAAETSGRNILTYGNDLQYSVILAAGGVIAFEYYKQDNYWVML